MWAKAPSMQTLRALREQIRQTPYTCRRCATATSGPPHHQQKRLQPPSPSKQQQQLRWRRRRSMATAAAQSQLQPQAPPQAVPVTAVNVKKDIPPAFKELYEELLELEKVGANYVNLSLLRLALRSLESEDATIRVAVLGINGQSGARRLVGALLADPLKPTQEWEASLRHKDSDARAVLVKYGEEFDLDNSHPLLRTISVPSIFLRQHKVELLVHEARAATAENQGVGSLERLEQLLVPALSTPTSATGRSSTVTYPAHKALVYGEGLKDARELFQLIPSKASDEEALVHGALNVQAQDLADQTGSSVLPVNVARGEAAIAEFRESIKNSFEYEHHWLESNLGALLDALVSGTKSAEDALKPVLRAQIELIIRSALVVIISEQEQHRSSLASSSVPVETRQSLQDAITVWAEAAHTELREDVAMALESRSWRKLVWWKLIWRVDDISLLLTDIVQRSYLSSAEKHIIWVGGRMQQAGLLPPALLSGSSPSIQSQSQAEQRRSIFSPPSQEEQLRMLSATIQEDYNPDNKHHKKLLPTSSTNIIDDPSAAAYNPANPWPQQLALSRARLLSLLPALQSRAQTLLLQSLSTAALSSTVASLAYLSVSSTSLYETGAVAALGTVLGARRLQSKWERARNEWMEEVRREGVKTLGDVERRTRWIVDVGPEGVVRESVEGETGGEVEDVQTSERALASRQLERVKGALERITAKGTGGKR